MGRPPLGAAAMTPAQREARRRRTARDEIAMLRDAVVSAIKVNNPAQKTRWMQLHADVIARAYAAHAAQRKE